MAPAAAATSRPSGKGKKASLASAEPRRSMPTRAALATRLADRVDARRRAAADRERAVGRGEHDRVALDVLHDPPGEGERAALARRRACARRHARASPGPPSPRPAPAPAGRRRRARTSSSAAGRRSGWKRSRRRFFFFVSSASASASKPGAISTSVKISSTARASARSQGRLETTMPPKGDSGSPWKARR